MPQIVCENLSLGYEGETIVKDLMPGCIFASLAKTVPASPR